MESAIKTEKHAILCWIQANEIEQGALGQARNLANLEWVHRHIALMPDVHQGFGMPIGGVAALKGYVIPNAVGVDIGCGMCAVALRFAELPRKLLEIIAADIKRKIPLGFKHHKRRQDPALMPDPAASEYGGKLPVVREQYESAREQIGTLGGGNHFIEFQQGSDGWVWIMVHSGSRNLGKQIADYYNKKAKDINKKKGEPVPAKWDLAPLELNSAAGRAYMGEMRYAVDFAYANRKLLMRQVLDIVREQAADFALNNLAFFEGQGLVPGEQPEIPETWINIAHNYAALEHHYGADVMVHRKGAVKAEQGSLGIVPGSQGSRSYIVRGKGEPSSFCSASHGAGRKLGRKAAQKGLDLQQEMKHLDAKGVIHSLRSVKDLDEAAGAYKDIDRVMEYQRDLVEVVTVLEPLAVIKG